MRIKRKVENIIKKIKTKKAIPYLLLLFVVCLSVAYSAFGTELNIGKFIADFRLERDIRITGISVENDSSPVCEYLLDEEGNEIVKCGLEVFYVIEKTASEIKMLTKYNIVRTNGLQDMSGGLNPKAFSETNYWRTADNKYTEEFLNQGLKYPYVYDERSLLYERIESYKSLLIDMGVNVIDAKLMSYEQATALGCSLSANTCTSAPSWVYSNKYWLGSANVHMMIIDTNGRLGGYGYQNAHHGIRPVITISTSSVRTGLYQDYNISSISLGMKLPTEHSSITYNVEITNIEATEMGLLEITGLPDNLEYELGNYKLNEKICDDTGKCNLGITKEIELTIKYKEGGYDRNNTSFDFKLDFNFQPYYQVKYENIEKDYDIGDVLTFGSESFYVIEDDKDTVTMLAKYNLALSETNPLQDPTDTTYPAKNPVAFSNDAYWVDGEYGPAGDSEYLYVYDGNSIIYNYIEAYADVLYQTGVDVLDSKLMSYEQAISLGCVDGESASCESAPSWVYSSSYWLGSALDEDDVLHIDIDGVLNYDGNDYVDDFGIRPVITISKNDLLKLPTEVIANGTLEVDFSDVEINDIIVRIDGTDITNYTYEDGILRVPTVNGNIQIIKPYVCNLTKDSNGNKQIDLGEEVTCGTEVFYVMKNDSVAHSTAVGDNITLFSKYNLDVGSIYDGTALASISNPTGIQNPEAIGMKVSGELPYYGVVPFSAENYWGSAPAGQFIYDDRASIYEYVENYKTYMIEELQVNVKEASLASSDQYNYFYKNNRPQDFFTTSFWLGSAFGTDDRFVALVNNNGAYTRNYYHHPRWGVRPILVVSSSIIGV